ncbi:PAS domain S-box protein [Flavimarina sp. Hel_I_48]|uniref:PAS domain S-box protein n=1 Tax=Flavimarina sp. Hel_I_48 TaxID=1392488 RepID=UPI001F13D1D2|nr:PAS domain S-box protein [Flavimarina sp. Hel_I_48]
MEAKFFLRYTSNPMQLQKKIEVLERALIRERASRKEAESILEQKSSELYDLSQELKESNSKLSHLLDRKTSELEGVFENIIDSYVIIKLSGEVIKMNQAAINLLGYDVEEEPVNLIELVIDDYKEYTFEAFRELVIHGKFNNYQAVIQTKNDGEKTVQINASVIYNSEGQPIAAQGIARDITEEIRIKKLLEDQTKQLNIIFKNSPIGISLSKTLSRGLIMVNQSLCDMLGYNPKEFDDLSVQELTHPDDNAETEKYRDLIFSGEIDTYKVEKRYFKKNGEILWANTSVTAVRDQSGTTDYLVATIEDITQKKLASTRLQESENRMATLIMNLRTAILLEDENNKISLTNQKFCNMFKIPVAPDTLKGSDCSNAAEEFKHFFEDSESFPVRIEELLNEKKTVVAEELKLKDGRVVERSYIPIYNDGLYKGHLWSYDDITISKLYKESLRAQKEKYSSIIANMNLGLVEVDNKDNIVMTNNSFTEISGYSKQELKGNPINEIFPNIESQKAATKDYLSNSDDTSNSYEVEAKTKNGDTRNWLISGAPNYDVNGKTTGSIGIFLDITDRKKLEQQRIELLKNLEIQNEQLNDYAHIVSHDLKSPLRNISALISWTKEDFKAQLGSDSLNNLDLIQTKVEKMDHLIENILKYSSIENGALSEDTIDTNILVNEIVSMIFVPDHIEIKIIDKLPTIYADNTRMQQLFQNLISNAVNYIDKENGLVEIEAEEQSDHYIFSIKDNGCGIPEEYHEKIFKIFSSATTDKKSTGIGLSIVKKIVDLYNGRVWLNSVPNEGTTFYFSIKK